MGLQKYRADYPGMTQHGGAIPWYTRWMGGPTLALIRNCPIKMGDAPCCIVAPRTVYVRGEADTMYTIPAACTVKRKTVKGYLTCTDNKWEFRAHLVTSEGTNL